MAIWRRFTARFSLHPVAVVAIVVERAGVRAAENLDPPSVGPLDVPGVAQELPGGAPGVAAVQETRSIVFSDGPAVDGIARRAHARGAPAPILLLSHPPISEAAPGGHVLRGVCREGLRILLAREPKLVSNICLRVAIVWGDDALSTSRETEIGHHISSCHHWVGTCPASDKRNREAMANHRAMATQTLRQAHDDS